MARKKSTAKKPARTHALVGGKSLVAPGQPTAKERVSKGSAAPRRVMVIVHGGGDTPENYYETLVSAVKDRLGKPFKFIAAYYSDIVTGPARGVAATVAEAESPAVARFKAEYEQQLRKTYAKTQAEKQPLAAAGLFDHLIDAALADTIDEVVQYLLDPNVASEVQARLVKAFNQAAQKRGDIVLVSHSLGTVVSYDVLNRLADHYNIAYWFTLGCPLAKLVNLRRRDTQIGKIDASHIARWHNVYDTNDFVGDAIGTTFNTADFHIHDIFVEVASAMPAAHDYFNNPATLDLIADAMR